MTTANAIRKIIREKCLQCCSDSYEAVASCNSENTCKLFPLRVIRRDENNDVKQKLQAKSLTSLQLRKLIKAHCSDCIGEDQVKKCTTTDCVLYPFRLGKDPNPRKQTEKQKIASKALGERRKKECQK